MYREMRRNDRALAEEEARKLLAKAEYGVLSTAGEDGQPYGVPLSFVVVNGSVCFHCALTGQKIDNLAHEPRASFCVVGGTQPVYEPGNYSTFFESAVAFGKVYAVTDEQEKRDALYALVEKYLPEHLGDAESSITHSLQRTAVYKLPIEHVTGKAKKRK